MNNHLQASEAIGHLQEDDARPRDLGTPAGRLAVRRCARCGKAYQAVWTRGASDTELDQVERSAWAGKIDGYCSVVCWYTAMVESHQTSALATLPPAGLARQLDELELRALDGDR